MTQPVLDYLLWHHLGADYTERAHDLVNIYKHYFEKDVKVVRDLFFVSDSSVRDLVLCFALCVSCYILFQGGSYLEHLFYISEVSIGLCEMKEDLDSNDLPFKGHLNLDPLTRDLC